MSTKQNTETHSTIVKLPDDNQSFWDLSAIQLTSFLSLPVLSTSAVLLKTNSFIDAIATVILSNIILWVIRYAIIKMSFSGKKSAIGIAEEYLGHLGGKIVGIVFIFSAFLWFNKHTTFSAETLSTFWQIPESKGINQLIQFAIVMGILSTIVCAGGMKWIRKFSLYSLPFLLVGFIIILYLIDHQITLGTFSGISIPGLVMLLGVNLAISIDLPTFFRHGRSEKSTIQALTTIQLITLLFSLGALYLGSLLFASPQNLLQNSSIAGGNHNIFNIIFPLLVAITTICANVFNIYACSVGWEVLVPKSMRKLLLGSKEYLVLGLGLTALYINPFATSNLEEITNWVDNAEVSLCFVFIAGWLIYLSRKKTAQSFEKIVYTTCWILSAILSSISHKYILISWILMILTINLLIFGKYLMKKAYDKTIR